MTDELLTIQELAERLKIKPDTVREKMRRGIFQKGVHYYRRKGMRPLFKWSAILAWLDESSERTQQAQPIDQIPMSKGYMLGQNNALTERKHKAIRRS